MKNTMRLFKLLSILTVGLSLDTASVKAATANPQCTDGPLPSQCSERYRAEHCDGFRRGVRWAKLVWQDTAKGCDDVDAFTSHAEDAIKTHSPSEDWDANVACWRNGYARGIGAYLDEVHMECGGDCREYGASWGESVATDYCALSIALRGIHGMGDFIAHPVERSCGRIYETSCFLAWDTITSTYQEGPLPEQRCVTYTRDDQYDSRSDFLGDFWDANLSARQALCEMPKQ